MKQNRDVKRKKGKENRCLQILLGFMWSIILIHIL